MAGRTDKYANVLTGTATANGATVVSVEIQTGISLGKGVGMLIDQIDYDTQELMSDFVAGAEADYLHIAWGVHTFTQANDFRYDNNRMIHKQTIRRTDIGVAASGMITINPQVYQFIPALIVAAPRLTINLLGSAAISGTNVYSRVYFRYVDLSDKEYLEVAESFVLLS